MAGTSIATAFIDIVPTIQGIQGNLGQAFRPAEREADAAGDRAGKKFAMVAAAGIAAGGAVVTVALKKLFDVGSVFDDVSDTIRANTGKSGAALAELEGAAKKVATTIPTSFEAASETISTVTQRLGLSGDALTTVSSQFLEAGRALGQDVDIDAASKALSAFGVKGDAVSGQLDNLFRVSQSTGVGMNELTSAAAAQAPALQELGFNFEQTVGLVGALDKAGLNATAVTASMGKGLVKLAKDGEAPQEAFQRITGQLGDLVAQGNTAGAIDLASGIFGTKGATQMVAAIQSGTLNMQDLSAAAVGTGDTILGVAAETNDAAESWQLLKNKGLAALEPLGSAVFGFAGDKMKLLADSFDDVGAAVKVLATGDFQGGIFGLEEDSPLVGALITIHDVMGQISDTVGPIFKELFAAIGPVLKDMFDQIGPIFKEVGSILGPALVEVFNTLKPAIMQLIPIVTQLLPVFNPVGLLFKALLPILPQIASVVGELAKVIAGALASALTALAPLFTTLVSVIQRLMPFFTQLVASLLPPLMKLFEKLAPLLEAVLGALIPVVDAIIAALIPAIEALMPVVEIVFGFIATTIQNVMTVIGGVIDVITGLFTGDWQKVWDGVLQIFSGVWDQIKNVISTIGTLFTEFFTNLGPKIWEIITGLATTIVGWGNQFLQWIFDGIVAIAPSVYDWFTSLPGWIWKKITAFTSWLAEKGGEFLSWIWDGIKAKAEEVFAWFSSLPGWLWDRITALTSVIFDYGVQFLQWIWDGITNLFPQILDWFGALPGKAWDMIVALSTTIVSYGGSFIGWIKDGIVNGAVAIWDFFTGLPGKVGEIIVGIGKDLVGLGVSLVGKIVEGVVSVAGDIWQAITDALTGGSDTSNPLSGGQPGVVFGGSSRGGVIHNTGGGDSGFAAGGVVPGRDPGRRDNVLARLPNGRAWGLRSREAVMVPEFTDWVGGERGVNAWNRLAEQGRLGDIGLGLGGYATGGVVGTYAAAKAYGASEAWKRAKELIQANADNPITGLGVAPPGARGEFMKAVASQMGLPYVWGGASPPNFDCSGLMSWALTQAGMSQGRLTAAQFGDNFPRVNPPKPGDMAIFDTGRVSPKAGHIGMVLDPAAGTMMHTDGAGPSRVSDYTRRGGLMGFIDAIGGTYTAPGSSIGAAVGSGMSNLMLDLLGKARKKLGITLDNSVGPSGEVGTAAYNISGGVEQWRGLAMNALKAVGQFKGMDLTYAIDKLLYQMQTESSGNPNAINLTDSNAQRGTPSKGLLQTIDPTFQSALRGTPFEALIPNGPYDPWSNIVASILYGLNAYGSLDKAYRGVAYDNGGWLMPGQMLAPNLLNKPEAVLRPDQSAAYITHAKALADGYGGQVVINLDSSDPLQVAMAQMIRDGVETGLVKINQALPIARQQMPVMAG